MSVTDDIATSRASARDAAVIRSVLVGFTDPTGYEPFGVVTYHDGEKRYFPETSPSPSAPVKDQNPLS